MSRPVIFSALQGYTRGQLFSDLTAGVIVAIVALPLSIAFAIASGLPPEFGLRTAVVAGVLISLLGGSTVQIGGPTGAFVVIVYGIVQTHGVEGLAVATLMAGIGLVIMGVVRMGAAIKFIPYPVTTGFTSGIAVVIFSGQVKDFLGLEMGSVPVEFLAKWEAFGQHLGTLNPAALGVSALTVLTLILWPKINRRIPGPLLAVVLSTGVAAFFGLDVETIGSRFGAVALTFPTPSIPTVSLETMRALVPAALSIALLGGVESLLSAVVADGMTGERHDSNQELIGQGVANIVGILFGGMPATGAIARTATNVRAGGRTPVAGLTHAVVLGAMAFSLGPWVGLIPMATLAGILVIVAYHMSEWRMFKGELSGPRSDVAVLLTTFGLTVLVDLTVAIEVGVVLAALLFMRRMAEVTQVSAISAEFQEGSMNAGVLAVSGKPLRLPPGVIVYRINGPFFFGAAEKFKETLGTVAGRPRFLVLAMGEVPTIDATGLNALRGLVRRFLKDGTRVLFVGVQPGPEKILRRSGLLDELDYETLFPTVEEALTEIEFGSPLGEEGTPGVGG